MQDQTPYSQFCCNIYVPMQPAVVAVFKICWWSTTSRTTSNCWKETFLSPLSIYWLRSVILWTYTLTDHLQLKHTYCKQHVNYHPLLFHIVHPAHVSYHQSVLEILWLECRVHDNIHFCITVEWLLCTIYLYFTLLSCVICIFQTSFVSTCYQDMILYHRTRKCAGHFIHSTENKTNLWWIQAVCVIFNSWVYIQNNTNQWKKTFIFTW